MRGGKEPFPAHIHTLLRVYSTENAAGMSCYSYGDTVFPRYLRHAHART